VTSPENIANGVRIQRGLLLRSKKFIREIFPDNIANIVRVEKEGYCCANKESVTVTSLENIAIGVRVLKGGYCCV
jgi:hypothetical protein